jgi:beta-1,4-mannosyl-glycoprotein beta-1,4-N-acetylglucosaminyltransferase
MIYDCFTYFNEDLILDLRFNILFDKVDYFVIIEGNKTHSGKTKKKNFQIEKFSKFKKKIKYFFIENMPNDNNSWELENFQRNQIMLGLKKANKEDLILISDCDEIPNLKTIRNIDLKKIKNNIFVFEQKCFYYKLNLLNPGSNPWHGTKLVRYDFLKESTPQNIRNYKIKQYPFWRIDRPKNAIILKNGGWHFSFLNNINKIKHKLESFAHTEFNKNIFTNKKNLRNKVKNYQDLFDDSIFLKKINVNSSYPEYIVRNKKKFKNWIVL